MRYAIVLGRASMRPLVAVVVDSREKADRERASFVEAFADDLDPYYTGEVWIQAVD